ncbi:MAG: hypothetical protein CR959_01805 [Fusobacteriales bacterium]|nr:MAG: hypothetical protein CR959_01805 [Fusobacteriales bacterium]
MAKFERKTYEKKAVVRDIASIEGMVDGTIGKINFGEVLAYNTTSKKWVKYENATHNTGVFLLGVAKKEIEEVTEDITISVLTQGELNREDIAAAKDDEILWSLLAKQGIYLL